MESVQVCESCGARHIFFYEPYQGSRVHSAVREDITLGCRKCKEPMMEWCDKDGDMFFLVLEDDESVPRLRERQARLSGGSSRRRQRETGNETDGDGDVVSGPRVWRPGTIRIPSLHPLGWVVLVCLLVAVYVAWVVLRK